MVDRCKSFVWRESPSNSGGIVAGAFGPTLRTRTSAVAARLRVGASFLGRRGRSVPINSRRTAIVPGAVGHVGDAGVTTPKGVDLPARGFSFCRHHGIHV